METHQLVAAVLAFTAVVDLMLIPVVGARVAPQQKTMVSISLFGGAMTIAGLAAAFWLQLIPLG